MTMKAFSVTRALGDGFELVGRRPLAVLVWGALLTLPYVLIVPMTIGLLQSIPPTAWDDSETMNSEFMAQMMQFQALSNLTNVVAIAALVFVSAAVFRAVLFPERSKAFYLRASLDELRLAVVSIAVFIGWMLAAGLVVLILALIGVSFAHAAPAVQGLAWVLLGLIGTAAIVIGFAHIALMGPATIGTADFAFAAGWRGARRSWGRLSALTVLLVLIAVVLQMLFYVVFAGLLGLAWAMGLLGDIGGFFTSGDPSAWRIDVARAWGLVALLFVPVSMMMGVVQTVMLAPFASAWRQVEHGPQAAGAPDASVS